MSDTWKEHAPSDQADILSLVDQVQATESLLEQIRLTLQYKCAEALSFVKAIFFAGDTDAFEKMFFVPLVFNSFNAGATTMSNILNQFVQEYQSDAVQTIVRTYDMVGPTDVFGLMSDIAVARVYQPIYKQDASDYVVSIFAAFLTLVKERVTHNSYAEAYQTTTAAVDSQSGAHQDQPASL